MPPGWRFLVEPRWIASHLFVVVMVVAMVELGLWQVHRLEGRRQINAMLAARMAAAPVPIDRLVSPSTPVADADHLLDRRASVAGAFDSADQVVVGPETDADGNPGWWVVTPIVTSGGAVVVVNRGFIPYDAWSGRDLPPASAAAVLAPYRPPPGRVTVTGLVAETQPRTEGLRDPPTGRLTTLHRLDLSRIARQLHRPTLPIVLDEQRSPAAPAMGYPESVAAPSLDEGPHLSYAIQWFSFTAVTVLLYPFLLRRRSRRPRADDQRARRRAADRRAREGIPEVGEPRTMSTPHVSAGRG